MLQTLKHLDRRVIFLVVLITAVLPLIFPVRLPIKPGPDVTRLYHAISALPDDAVVFLGFDYGPSTEVELQPAAIANVVHMWTSKKNLRLVAFELWPEGAAESRKAFRIIVSELARDGIHKRYGVDYVNLGFKSGGVVALRTLGSGFRTLCPTDIDGTPLDNLPLMKDVNKWSDVNLAIDYSAGDPGIKQYVQVVVSQYGREVSGAVTAVSAPEMSPYVSSGQLTGLMGGLRGAAEYESLIHLPAEATAGMNVQSFVHMILVTFIILSNVIYFADKRASRRR